MKIFAAFLVREIKRYIEEKNVSKFYVGGYEKFDEYAVNAVTSIKTKYAFVKLIYVAAYLSKLETNRKI